MLALLLDAIQSSQPAITRGDLYSILALEAGTQNANEEHAITRLHYLGIKNKFVTWQSARAPQHYDQAKDPTSHLTSCCNQYSLMCAQVLLGN